MTDNTRAFDETMHVLAAFTADPALGVVQSALHIHIKRTSVATAAHTLNEHTDHDTPPSPCAATHARHIQCGESWAGHVL